METLRAIMTTRFPSRESNQGSCFGVLEDDSDKLRQPLIASHDGTSYHCYYDSEPLDDEDEEAGRGYSRETDHLLHRTSSREYDIPTKNESTSRTSAAVLKSIVANVLWPMTPVGSQVAKVYEAHTHSTAGSAARVEERNALHTVTTLTSLTKPRRRLETMEDLHEKALARIAGITLFFSAWLIVSVYQTTPA